MSMEAIVARSLDAELWPVNLDTYMREGMRKWKDRPPFVKGEAVSILKAKTVYEQYGPIRRVLVHASDGRERWMDAIKVASTMDLEVA